jgi:protein-disulfide isomerase
VRPSLPMRVALSRTLIAGLLAVVFTGIAPAAHAADDEAGKKVVEYYRRKANIPPEVDAKLTNVRDSKIPGVKNATIEMSRGGRTQTVDLLMSPDGKYVAFAEIEDVSSDPFKAIADKIKLDGEPSRGPKDAKVVIVEYSDFQCPYCSRAHATIEDQVMKEYGDKVRLVYKHFPLGFHKWAELGAIGAECAEQQSDEAFWVLYNFYFKNQQQITPENLKDKSLEALAGTKIDQAKFTDCFDNKKTLDKVKADMAEGQEVGVTGTPAFIINGRKLSGAQPYEKFKDIIDDELSRKGT